MVIVNIHNAFTAVSPAYPRIPARIPSTRKVQAVSKDSFTQLNQKMACEKTNWETARKVLGMAKGRLDIRV